ncbi:hypothetical protein VTO73DRAFT_14468 [Trametes versicolor]
MPSSSRFPGFSPSPRQATQKSVQNACRTVLLLVKQSEHTNESQRASSSTFCIASHESPQWHLLRSAFFPPLSKFQHAAHETSPPMRSRTGAASEQVDELYPTANNALESVR